MRSRRLYSRILVAAVGVVAIVLATAAPADAHTISGPRPSNYRSRVLSVTPSVSGIWVRVVDLGSKLELTNDTSREVTVLGYVGEPYLRIGPDGVFENLHSAATYLNRGRKGGAIPPDVDTSPTAEPRWSKVSSAHTSRFHDHRIHWMNDQPPRPVQQNPDRLHELTRETVTVVDGDTRILVNVALDWVPGPSGVPWIPVIAGLLVVGFVVAYRPQLYRVLAAVLGLLVVVDAVHAITYEIPRPGGNGSKALDFLAGSFVSIVVWLAAIPTIIGVLRRRTEALYGVVFVGLMVALVGGATDLSALWKSQLPNAGPELLTRVEVVIALGLGAGVVLGALARIFMSGRSTARADGGGRWLSVLVTGLDDRELDRIARDLDADDILEVAMRELAVRLEPVADQFATGSLVFDVDGARWSIERGEDGLLRSRPGVADAVAVEIAAPFPRVLQLLAGTITLDDPRVANRGDSQFVERIEPFLAERATAESDGRAPAS